MIFFWAFCYILSHGFGFFVFFWGAIYEGEHEDVLVGSWEESEKN